jgi:hypothetical protein
VSNCVTTPTNTGGRPRTPTDRPGSSEPHHLKAESPPKLLRDEEVILQGLTATPLPAQLALMNVTDSVAEARSRCPGTRAPDRLTHPSWLTALG